MISPLSVDHNVRRRRLHNFDFQLYAIMNAEVASTNYNSFNPLTTADPCKTTMNIYKKRA
jgi:hypothetical protein